MRMEYNIGSTDRTVHVIAGAGLVAVGVAMLADALEFGTTAGGVAVVIGTVLLGTALIRTCLLYHLLAIDTSEFV